ncbi:MAG: thrombospondin type 3 repeat-containing protein [Phycisphaerae bacterium]|nr:thrombospondin type 3 repeat-containing protein [Phycisphaerae bacterium]
MSRVLQPHGKIWPLIGFLAVIPLFFGQNGCPMISPAPTPTPDSGAQPSPVPSTPTNAAPSVLFTSPIAGSAFALGDAIFISFNANDPENNFQYDLVYDQNGAFNGDETTIVSASSVGTSLVQTFWTPAGLPGGDYFIGVFVSDNGGNASSAFVGPITLVSGPTINVTAPAASTAIAAGGAVNIFFAGNDPDGISTIDVFYDTDTDFSNGIANYIQQELGETDTSALWNTTGVPDGTYFVGASIGRDGAARVAAYAPGAVQISISGEGGTGGTADLAGLSITVSEPASGVTVAQNAQLAIEYRGRDTRGTATVTLFYDDDTNYDNGVLGTIATNLALGEDSFNWTANIAPGLYRVGASIGRSATARIPAYAAGKVLVTPSSGGGGGGGGGTTQIPVTISFVTPATNINWGREPYNVEFRLDPGGAVGSVTLSYARDDNNDGQPDSNWIPFASNLTVGQLTAQFNAGGAMPAGKYLFHGAFAPTTGTPYAAAQAVAPGSLKIITNQTIDVTGPAGNIVRSWADSVTVSFSALDPVGESSVYLFYDENTVFENNEVWAAGPLAENATSAQIPAGLTPGLYFVGAIIWRDTSAWTFDYAPGAVLIRGTGDPAIPADALVVLTPDENQYLQQGNVLETKWFINSSTLSGTVTVFLEGVDGDGNPNGLRAYEKTGLNPAQCIFGILTEEAPAGKYFVGVSHNRTDGTAVTEYAKGAVTIMSSTRPFVDVEEPAFNTWVRRGENAWIYLFAHDPIGTSTIDLFHDRDQIFGNQNEVPLTSTTGAPLQNLQVGTSYAWFDTSNMSHGIYSIGASMERVEGSPIAHDYARGRLLVWDMVRNPVEPLEVIAPISPSINVSEGASIGVRWFVFSLSNTGTIRVFAEPDLDNDGIPDGSDYRVYAAETLKPYDSTFAFPTGMIEAGSHAWFMGVTYTPQGGGPTTRYAPGVVYVRPRSVWVGDIATQNISGAIFEGVNFNDMAGSNVTPVADLNGDGIDDFVIVSQFGKPNSGQSTGGAAAGEAYLVYGGPHLTGKTFKLNATGVLNTAGLPGLVFEGVATTIVPGASWTPGDYGGITQVIAIPDQDSDDLPELVFGVPNANSIRGTALTKEGHFLRGGAVLVSSTEELMYNPTAQWPNGSRVVSLLSMGQSFQGGTLTRTPMHPQHPLNRWGCVPLDSDGDGIPDDGDGSGTARDNPCVGPETSDCDDNCPFHFNPRQEDANPTEDDPPQIAPNGVGDACDPAMPGVLPDVDGDGIPDPTPNNQAPQYGWPMCNPQLLADGTDCVDNCRGRYNPLQTDIDGNDIGDACDDDMDGDGRPNASDNCVGVPNPNQEDVDRNGIGDLCEDDIDGDGIGDATDNCPDIPNADQTDRNGNGFGDACDQPRSDCSDVMDCAFPSPVVPPGFEADDCSETAVDHGYGFFPELVADDAIPVWNNGRLWPNGSRSGHNNHEICKCPQLRDASDSPVSANPGEPIVGDQRPSTTEDGVFLSTGFYTNTSHRQYGFRLLGEGLGDQFAQSISFVDDMLLIGAPAYSPEKVQDPEEFDPATRTPTGKAYQIKMRNLAYSYDPAYGHPTNDGMWDRPYGPRPYQYVVGKNEGRPGSNGLGYWTPLPEGSPFSPTFYVSNGAPRSGEQLGFHVAGTADFNNDALGDVLIGAPSAFSSLSGGDNSGAVYLLYRRMTGLDNDRDLSVIEAGSTDGSKLFGALIRGRGNDRLGHCVGFGADLNGDGIAEVLDLNHDGLPDVVLGNHMHDNQRGEVVILFGNPYLQSPADGFRIEDPNPARDLVHNGLAAIFKGEQVNDQAGFNVGYAGDFDGDGKPDLLIAAPGARVDIDGDGTAEAANAGKVYLIFGSNDIGTDKNGNGQLDREELVYNLADVGKPGGLKGLVFIGREAGDRLGGGEVAPYDPATPGTLGTTGMRARNLTWAGDINQDGYADILIGAPVASAGNNQAPGGTVVQGGEVYLIFGFPTD